MKSFKLLFGFLPLFAFIFFTSCQKENIESNLDTPEETIIHDYQGLYKTSIPLTTIEYIKNSSLFAENLEMLAVIEEKALLETGQLSIDEENSENWEASFSVVNPNTNEDGEYATLFIQFQEGEAFVYFDNPNRNFNNNISASSRWCSWSNWKDSGAALECRNKWTCGKKNDREAMFKREYKEKDCKRKYKIVHRYCKEYCGC